MTYSKDTHGRTFVPLTGRGLTAEQWKKEGLLFTNWGSDIISHFDYDKIQRFELGERITVALLPVEEIFAPHKRTTMRFGRIIEKDYGEFPAQRNETAMLFCEAVSSEQMAVWGYTYAVVLRHRYFLDPKLMKLPPGYSSIVRDRKSRASVIGVKYRDGLKVIDGGPDDPLATWMPGGVIIIPVLN
jgi:hypothetical protein